MTDMFDREEDELQHRQGSELYPVGRSLRSTFPAPDGDTLQSRIASLMVELSHQPYERAPVAAPPPAVREQPPGLLQQLTRFFRRPA